MALRLIQPLTEMSNWHISWGWRRPVRRADLTTFMCPLFWNLGASTSWNPQGLSRPVMGFFLYLQTVQILIVRQLESFDTDSLVKCSLTWPASHTLNITTQLQVAFSCPAVPARYIQTLLVQTYIITDPNFVSCSWSNFANRIWEICASVQRTKLVMLLCVLDSNISVLYLSLHRRKITNSVVLSPAGNANIPSASQEFICVCANQSFTKVFASSRH